MKKLKYEINDIYYYNKSENIDLLIELEQNKYRSIITNDIVKYNSIELDSLSNLLKICGLEILVITINGNKKQFIDENDIKLIIKSVNKLKSMNFIEIKRIEMCSNKLANIISNLLGINITYKNEKFKNKYNLEDIIIPAKKEYLFQKILKDFIKASFLLNSEITITNENEYIDYRILKALNLARINNLDIVKNNSFILKADLLGNLNINGNQVSQAGKENNFQKIIKF